MIYKLRVLLDTEEDVFRDIELPGEETFEYLHFCICEAFGWTASEMASFYESNDNWDKGEEIPLMDIQEEFGPKKLQVMSDVKVSDKLKKVGQKYLYVFDFMLMWCFYVEVVSIHEVEEGAEYPRVTMDVGETPHQKDKEPVDFRGNTPENEFEDGYDSEDPEGMDFDEYTPN